jgi:DNA-binding NarL/FixJ family response regulator
MIIEVPAYDPNQLPERARHKDRGWHRIQRTPIKTSIRTTPKLPIALVESDPVRLLGLRALLESELDVEISAALLPEIAIKTNIDAVLIGDRPRRKLFDTMPSLNLMRPNLPIIMIGPGTDDEIILNAIVCGAKGSVFDGAPPSEFA